MPKYDDLLFSPPAPVVRLDLIFQNKTFKGRFPVIEGQDWGIIGRDVLNHVVILLNGPRLVWEMR